MINRYSTKADLYCAIEHFRTLVRGIEYPLDVISIINKLYPEVKIGHEKIGDGKEIRGMLFEASDGSPCIILNKLRDKIQQNYDCAHELCHLLYHGRYQPKYICLDAKTQTIEQDKILEWQANEGAAELLVPYQQLIPAYAVVEKKTRKYIPHPKSPIQQLADKFSVSYMTMRNRISSLSYEIDQYTEGIPISEVVVLSKARQNQMGIFVNDRADYIEMFDVGVFIPKDLPCSLYDYLNAPAGSRFG